MIKSMDMVNSIGLMVDHTEVIGQMESNMAEEFIKVVLGKKERENG